MTDEQENSLRTLFRRAEATMVAEPVSLEQTLHRARQQRVRRIGAVTLGVAAVVVLMVGVTAGLLRPSVELFTPAADSADALWGRTFFSVSAIDDGRPRPLAPGTRISLTFASDDDIEGDFDALRETYESSESDLSWEDGNGYMFWDVGCNQANARVAITAEGIRTGRGLGTGAGCGDDEVREQEAWLGGFLGSEPAWELEADQLVLTSGDDAIELTEDRLPLTADEFRQRWNANALDGGFPDLVVPPEEPLDRELSPRGRDGQPVVMRAGSANSDGTMIEAYVTAGLEPDPDDPETWTGIGGDEAVRMGAWRVLVRTVSPELGWQEVEDLLEELGVAGDDQELRHRDAGERTAVRGEVRWGTDGYKVLARPVTAVFAWKTTW